MISDYYGGAVPLDASPFLKLCPVNAALTGKCPEATYQCDGHNHTNRHKRGQLVL